MQDALAQNSFPSVPEPDLEGAQLWGSATALVNGNIPGKNGDLFWVAGKSNVSKLGSLKIRGCFCASLESPSRGTGSTAKSQAASEP